MKLLIISHSYSPDLTPRAFRWTAIAEQLARNGHQVHILCAATSIGCTGGDEVVVHRVRDWLVNATRRATPQSDTGAVGRTSFIRATMRKWVRAIWRTFCWPDYACGWIVPAVFSARRLCSTNRYDWIISVSHPFSGHIVGMLAKKFCSSARWLVDIGDPFHLMEDPPPNNRRLYARLNHLVESRVVSVADQVSVTTEATGRIYEAYFQLAQGRISIIPPLLSLPTAPERSAGGDPFIIRLAFVGTLYRRLRNPRRLMKAIDTLIRSVQGHKIELHFYGAINDCQEEFDACPAALKQSLFVHGLVSRENVLQAMVDADILVNIGNDCEAQLASKVVEYMAVGKPILNVISHPYDISVIALAGYPASMTIARSCDGMDAALIDALIKFVLFPPKVSQDVITDVRRRYSAERVTKEYEKILDSASHRMC